MLRCDQVAFSTHSDENAKQITVKYSLFSLGELCRFVGFRPKLVAKIRCEPAETQGVALYTEWRWLPAE
jgi:hypothetical protein